MIGIGPVPGDRIFNRALLLSITVHVLILFIMPGFNLMKPWEASEWLDVDLLEPVDVDLPASPSEISEGGPAEGDSSDVLGESPLFPSPPVWLPERLGDIETDSAVMRLTVPTDFSPPLSGSGLTSPGLILTEEDDAGSDVDTALVKSQPPELTWKPSQTAGAEQGEDDPGDLQISGEVANRTVIFRPPAPRPTASGSGTVLLKFWVQPDGTIGKIIPITRSNPDLERVAIEYFEKWRFEAVKPDIGVQSGTIPIRFRLR